MWADSPYYSQEIEALLNTQHLRSHLQEKSYHDKPLTAQQKERNRRRGRTQVRVEHVFGHQVTAMDGKFIQTIGVVQARARTGRKNLVYNFQRVLFPHGRQSAADDLIREERRPWSRIP